MAKIKDVAAVAGVSTATVSRTLSNPSVVNQQTREIVYRAIERTGYVFDKAASNFRKRRAGAVVAFLPNIANPYYSAILSGIANGLADSGYSLLVVDTRAGSDRAAYQYFEDRRADGLIVLLGSVPASILEAASRQPRTPPIVQVGEWGDGPATPRVQIRNAAAARLAVRHLIDLGHRDIGFLSGPRGNFTTETRLSGMIDALREAGLTFNSEWVLDGSFSLDAGRDSASRWMALDKRPTAVFCDSDEIACGFMGSVIRHGIAVPDDVSVVGFDDIEMVAHIHPALTTVRQPRRQMGEAAARILLSMMENVAPQIIENILDVELVVRDSTAAPRETRTDGTIELAEQP